MKKLIALMSAVILQSGNLMDAGEPVSYKIAGLQNHG